MRLKKEQRLEAETDLSHWGHVARLRWRAQPRQLHPIARMVQFGMVSGPTTYESFYEYETDGWFLRVNQVVIGMAEADRSVLVAHYIDKKPWKIMCRLMGLDRWWHVGKAVRTAEAKYLLLKTGQPLEN